VSTIQVSEVSERGRRYRKKRKLAAKPKEEWISVPVPDSGIPREVVDAAREAIADNKRVSNNGERFWELSGGILRCGTCGCSMRTNVSRNGKSHKRHYYYQCAKHRTDTTACPNRKSYRADRLEPDVWGAVSGLLTSPEQLRADLEAMIEGERKGMHGNPERETKAWLEKLAEVERKRSGYIDLAADGIMDRGELQEKLAALEETRETSRRELETLRGRQEQLEELERNKDALLESYAGIAPEALNTLLPDERYRIYGMLRLKVVARADGGLEVSGALGENVCTKERTSARTARGTCSWPRDPG
jgi:site-specific DNA recombinase